jgi:transcriptional regulator with XRE-family HTH domain
MPASVRRHNLARLREHLKLTQAKLAKLVRCAPITIRSIETGKLGLPRELADRIAAVTTCDAAWLLNNDLKASLSFSRPQPTAETDWQKVAKRDLLNVTSRAFEIANQIEDEASARLLSHCVEQFQQHLERTVGLFVGRRSEPMKPIEYLASQLERLSTSNSRPQQEKTPPKRPKARSRSRSSP